MLSEISQSWKDKYYIISFIYVTYEKADFIGVENRTVVTW
jgi:hypothetical protein